MIRGLVTFSIKTKIISFDGPLCSSLLSDCILAFPREFSASPLFPELFTLQSSTYDHLSNWGQVWLGEALNKSKPNFLA